MKVAVVTPAIHDPERLFGAERLFVGMVDAFRQKADTDWIQLPISEASWENVLRSYLDCYDLDLSAYDLVISTKNPTFVVQHTNHVCWLVHQIRVFYDRFDDEYGKLDKVQLAEKRGQQEMIQLLDNLAFQGVRKILTIGHEVARRLKQYNGFDAEVLYPPVLTRGQFCGGQEYFLLPGRLHRWKRLDLAINAMRHLAGDVPLLVPGTGEDEEHFRKVAQDDPRITFLGFVSDEELIALYANALAVLFVPKEEDFGYITIEAMLSHKPVIVCTDSGEPARLVQNGRSGFVVNPDPAEIATAMSMLLADRKLARDMGEAAYHSTPSQSWDTIVERLLDGATNGRARSTLRSSGTSSLPRLWQAPRDPVRVLVTDNQVLEPAIGGGRVRPKEICKGLASRFSTEYIGAFDWRGPSSTDDCPMPGWRCRVFSLSDLHYRLSGRLQRWVKGGSAIDVSFSLLAHTSREFLRALRKGVKQAEVVLFSHPWCYPLSKRLLKGKVVIYDSQNFEWQLRRELLSATPVGRLLARYVRHVEGELVRRSHVVWVCSWEDADAMAQAYGVSRQRFQLVPNCADTNGLQVASSSENAAAKERNGWAGRSVALFVGSGYGPNTEAAAFIIEELAPKFPETVFAFAGSVKEDYLRNQTADETARRFGGARVPVCIADGWFDAEEWNAGYFVRWTQPSFTLQIFQSDLRVRMELDLQSPNRLAIAQGQSILYQADLPQGRSIVEFTNRQPGKVQGKLEHERGRGSAADRRKLGCLVHSLSYVGGAGDIKIPLGKADLQGLLPANVELLGIVSEERLYSILHAADVALNPIEVGSGTNLKLIQYMAAGLAVISSEAGVRGIERGKEICIVVERPWFAETLRALLSDAEGRAVLGHEARQEAERSYDWGVVMDRASQGINALLRYGRPMIPPLFSVVIPTYNRKDHLMRALDALTRQTLPDFEVVIVDQSDPPVEIPQEYQRSLSIRYVYSQQRGPALARNKGIQAAIGLVVAFTDDDCIPESRWLLNAARYFDEQAIAGLEGRIRSEKLGKPGYRTVSNANFEGIGFMTANMFYRRDLLLKVGGFDEQFHDFREDTDLAWRVMEHGDIPHAKDVVVFHPPHRVNIERESQAERAKMFRVDPLLLKRHPDKYIELLTREGHYRKTPGYWHHFVRGLKEMEEQPPVVEYLQGLRARDPDWWAALDRQNDGSALTREDREALLWLSRGEPSQGFQPDAV